MSLTDFWKRATHLRWSKYPAVPALTQRHVSNCAVLPDRLAMLERLPKQSVCMEVGVLDGDFSDQILQRCNPAELHLVDLHTERFERRFESEAARGRVIVRRGYSWEILSSCNSGQFDWIYIDASHDYESVKRDAHAAADKVRREGVLIFNDYTYMCPNSFRKYGVIEAVNELCLEQDWELVFLCLQGRGFYDVAIRRVGQTRL